MKVLKKSFIADKNIEATEWDSLVILFGKKMIKIRIDMRMMAVIFSGMQIRMFCVIISHDFRGIKAGFQTIAVVPMHVHNWINLKKRQIPDAEQICQNSV